MRPRTTIAGFTVPQLLGGASVTMAAFTLPDALELHQFSPAVAALLVGVALARLAEPHVGRRLRHSDVESPRLLTGMFAAEMASSLMETDLPALTVLVSVCLGLLLIGDAPERWLKRRAGAAWQNLKRTFARPVLPG